MTRMSHPIAYKPDLDGSGPHVLLEGAPEEPLHTFICRLLSGAAGHFPTGDIYVGRTDPTGQPGPADVVLSVQAGAQAAWQVQEEQEA